MPGRLLSVLTVLAVVLGVGEFGSAVMIQMEGYPDAAPGFAVGFGVEFLLGAWLLHSGRVTAGTILVGILFLFEVVEFPGWTRHDVLDWVVQSGFGVVSLIGLFFAIAALVARHRSSAAAS